MTPDQEIRRAALNAAAVAWIGSDDEHSTTDQMLGMARKFEDYIRGLQPVPVHTVDADDFYCAGAVAGGNDPKNGCSHPRHSHGPYGCTMGHGSMDVPNCPCERPNGD